MMGNGEETEEYRTALRALAAGQEMPPDAVARLERDLRRAFVEHHAASGLLAPRSRAGRRWPWRFAAAAAVVLVVSAVAIWRQSSPVTQRHVTDAAASSLAVTSSSGVTVLTPLRPAPAVEARGAGGSKAAARPTRRAAAVLRPAGFVPLAEAAGLPPFESGSIVRVDVPVASLPGYGIDISPAADGQSIEADVLVGQDGQPRAIRLVTHGSRSSQ